MKQTNPADFFSKKKKLFEIKEIAVDKQLTEKTKMEVKAESKAIRDEACQGFQREVEVAVRDFITNTLNRLAVEYAHKHHEHGVTASMLIAMGIDEIKKEVHSAR